MKPFFIVLETCRCGLGTYTRVHSIEDVRATAETECARPRTKFAASIDTATPGTTPKGKK